MIHVFLAQQWNFFQVKLKNYLPFLLERSHVQTPKTHEINLEDIEPQESSCLHQCSCINMMYMNYSKINPSLRQHVTLTRFNERTWFVRFEFEATKCFWWHWTIAHACILKDPTNLKRKFSSIDIAHPPQITKWTHRGWCQMCVLLLFWLIIYFKKIDIWKTMGM
jgi:hypothetical protein